MRSKTGMNVISVSSVKKDKAMSDDELTNFDNIVIDERVVEVPNRN